MKRKKIDFKKCLEINQDTFYLLIIFLSLLNLNKLVWEQLIVNNLSKKYFKFC